MQALPALSGDALFGMVIGCRALHRPVFNQTSENGLLRDTYGLTWMLEMRVDGRAFIGVHP
eukprot:scaffold296642_cov19-Prasinocladus_malaysianus.AAC.1